MDYLTYFTDTLIFEKSKSNSKSNMAPVSNLNFKRGPRALALTQPSPASNVKQCHHLVLHFEGRCFVSVSIKCCGRA